MPIFGHKVDSRDGHVYKTVLMPDGKWWFAENLAWTGAGADYNNDAANRAIYGRLYSYTDAVYAVPSGCHMMSAEERDDLIAAVGPSTSAQVLKCRGLWSTDTGTDVFGFSAVPSGTSVDGSSFVNLHNYGYYWTTTPNQLMQFWAVLDYVQTEFSAPLSQLLAVRLIVDSGNVPDVTPQPSIYPPQGTYQGVQLVVLKSSQSLPIRYTLDGSEPTISSPLYVGPIPVYQDTQVKAAAFYGSIPSDTVTASYTITNGILKRISSYRDRVLPYLLEQYKGDNP